MICKICDEYFDHNSIEKKKSGGLITTCPDCSEETTVKYVGVSSADGKQAQATILKFESEQDKERYIRFWQNNSGLHKGKSCTLGNHLSTDPKIKFKTVSGFTPTNHKGKL
jgi:hypothetical protein